MAKHRSVKELLKTIKEYSSIAVDLAFYSLLSYDKESALEVIKIESEIDSIFEDLVAMTSLAVRSPEAAPIAVMIANLGRSLDKISDAAGDLAGLVIRGYPIHDYVRAAVNCCSEMVALLRATRKLRDIPSIVDLLVVRRGESYILAPRFTSVERGDILVVRGMPSEIAELARLLGDEAGTRRLGGSETLVLAQAGDELAEGLLRIKSLARSAVDLAFHSIVYGDQSLKGIIDEIEEEVDTLYHSILEASYAASNPGQAKEMVSISIFASAMEQLADASVQMARTAGREEFLDLVEQAIEESEEAYLRVRATRKVAGKRIGDLDFPDMGINVIAIGRRGSWIIPVLPEYTLEEGDLLLLKYFKPKGERSEEEIESLLRRLGFEVVED